MLIDIKTMNSHRIETMRQRQVDKTRRLQLFTKKPILSIR